MEVSAFFGEGAIFQGFAVVSLVAPILVRQHSRLGSFSILKLIFFLALAKISLEVSFFCLSCSKLLLAVKPRNRGDIASYRLGCGSVANLAKDGAQREVDVKFW